MACASHTPSIAASGMTLAQKLLADRALSPEQTRAVAGAISDAARVDAGGDVTRLKCVQCALALVQSVEDEATTSTAMAACVRVLMAESEGVSATAAATTRQAAFHVFSKVQPDPASVTATPTREGARVPTLTAVAETALILFEDLCALAGGKGAEWLGFDKGFATERVKIFALDAAAEIAADNAALFVDVPAFHHALRQKLCAALVTHLQSWQRSDVEEVSAPEGRAVLRCVDAVICAFHEAVPAETEMFLTTLLASLQTEMDPWRRSYTLDVIKSVVMDKNLARFLHAAYDSHKDSHKMIFQDSVLMLVRVTRAGLAPQPESGVEDILAAVTVLHRSKGKAEDVVPDDEDGAAHIAFSVFLAMEGVMGAAHAIASLATEAAEGDQKAGTAPDDLAARDATEMVASCSEMLLETLETVMTHATGEALVRDLLRALQAFAQGCGVLGATDTRDAFIAAICHFAAASEVVVPTVINIQDADDDQMDTPTRPSPLLRNISADSYEGGRDTSGGSIVGSVVGMGLGAVGAVGSVVASPVRALVGSSSAGVDPEVKINPASRVVLTSKNLQALRTLLGVAHRLIDSLGDGWVMVLETVCSLRRMLATKTTAASADMDATVAVLHVAEQQLFDSTAKLDDEALAALTKALAWVSGAELGRLGGGGGKAPVIGSNERLFMLERLVDVALVNSGRIHKIWPDVEAHILACIEKEPSAELCEIAMASLTRLCTSALDLTRTPEMDSLAPEGQAGFEIAVLRPVNTLIAHAVNPEARLAALETLMTVINRGEGISRAWASVLRALRAVAERGGAGIVPAFNGVKVIVEDHIEELPDDVSGEVIAAVAAFAAQRRQINTSMSAVSLEWTLSDYFGRKVADTRVGKEALAEREMIPLLAAMREASMDSRPEVRNSACRTFTSTLVSNGDKLPARIWRRAVFDILFALVDDVRAATASASEEEQAAPEIGELDGQKIQLMVHHSRNTERKQWDETETLALTGVGRLLRAHFDAVAKFDGFDKKLEWYLQWVTRSIAEGSPEVSCAAVKSLHTVMEAGGTAGMTRSRWKKATRVLMTAAKGMNAAGSKVSGKTRYDFIDTVGKIWASKRAVFDKEDIQSLIGVVDMLARAPDEWLEKSAVQSRAGRYSTLQVQRRCLDVLTDLPPLDQAAVDSGAYPQAICQLLAYIAEALGGEVAEAVAKADFAYPGTTTQDGSMSLGFAQEACEALGKIYQSEHVPKDDRAMTFAAATRVMSSAMTISEEEGAAKNAANELRVTAAKTFCSALAIGGLTAVTKSSAFEFRAASVADAWDALSTAFESTLSNDGRDPALEGGMIECLAQAVTPHCGFADEHSRRRLVAAVAHGSSVSRIWALSALHFGGGQMGRIALSHLVSTCERVMCACDEPEKVACVLDVASSLARDPSRRGENEPAPQSSSFIGWIKKTVAGETRNDLGHLRAILDAIGPCESSSDDVIRMKAEKVRGELTNALEM